MHNAMKRVIAVAGLFLVSILVVGMHHDAAAWWVSADFEAGAVGSLAQGASGFDEAGSQTTVSSDTAHGGGQSAKMVWNYDSTGFGEAMGVLSFPSSVPVGGELWMLGHFYFADPWSWQAASADNCGCAIKTSRAHISDAFGGHVAYTSVIANNDGVPYVGCETCNDMQGLNVYQGGAISLQPGRWYAIEMYIYFHPTQGVVRMWLDGELTAETSNIATARSGDDQMDFSYWMGYWNGRCGQDQVMYVDDVAMTTDTPQSRDAAGNPMIGASSGPSGGDAPPAAPVNLRVVY